MGGSKGLLGEPGGFNIGHLRILLTITFHLITIDLAGSNTLVRGMITLGGD